MIEQEDIWSKDKAGKAEEAELVSPDLGHCKNQ